MNSKIKTVIIIFSIICLVSAIAVLIAMPKPERALPELPEPNFNVEIRNVEINKDGYIRIIKFPVISSDGETDFTEVNQTFRNNEDDYSIRDDYPIQDGQNASYIINQYNVTLAAGNFLSCKAEGTFSNFAEDYYTVILKGVNYNVTDGEAITFDEVVSNDQKFYKAFCSGKFSMVKNDPQFDGKSSEELLGNFEPEYGIYPDYYIDGENFVIIANVPAVFGGYMEFSIPLTEAESFLNKNCDYIKMIYSGK